MKDKLLVVNLFAGPGAGKSTTRAGVFHKLKSQGVLVEEVHEYAKELTWDGNKNKLHDQLSVFAEQHWRQYRLIDKVAVCITDSPLPLSSMYRPPEFLPTMDIVVHEAYEQFHNVNFFLRRQKEYVPVGRPQTEDEAKAMDRKVERHLIDNRLPFTYINCDEYAVEIIAQETVRALERLRK